MFDPTSILRVARIIARLAGRAAFIGASLALPIAIFIVCLGYGARLATAETAGPTTDRTAEAPEATRDRLWAEAEQLYAAGQLADAAVVGEQLLQHERDWLGENNIDTASAFEWLASIYEEANDWTKALDRGQDAVSRREKIHGAAGWETVNARFALVRVKQLQKLTPAQLKKVREAITSEDEIVRLLLAHQHADAVALAQDAVAVIKDSVGEQTREFPQAVENLAAVHEQMGERAEAERLYRQSAALRKKLLGENHPDYAQNLDRLAWMYDHQGDMAQAIPLFKNVSEIYRQAYGDKDSDYAKSLFTLAGAYDSARRYEEAESLYLRSYAIDCETLGEKHLDSVTTLHDLAWMYVQMTDYGRAQPLLRRAVAMKKVLLGEKHPDYATGLNNLSYLYWKLGDYSRSIDYCRQALAIRKEVLGERSPEYAICLNNLAVLYATIGDYGNAEPYLRQALAIDKETLGEKNLFYAEKLNNLAFQLKELGQYERAEPLFRQVVEIRKEALGEEASEYAQSLSNLGVLYMSMRDYARAQPLLVQALTIRRKALGPWHREYGGDLQNLATLYAEIGDFKQAEPLCRQSLAVVRQALGEGHPDYAWCLGNLASTLGDLENYDEAERLYQQALELSEKLFGNHHPKTLAILVNMAQMYQRKGDSTKAGKYFKQAMAGRESYLQEQLPLFSQNEMQQYLATLGGETNMLFSFSPGAIDHDTQLVLALVRKGRVFHALCRQRRVQDALSRAPKLARQVASLRQKRQTEVALAMLPANGPQAQKLIEQRRAIRDEIEAQSSQLQTDLAARVGPDNDAAISVEAIRGRLSAGEALAEIIRYQPVRFDATGIANRLEAPRYVALICTSEASHPVTRVDLGPTEAIDALVREVSGQIASAPRELASFSEVDLEKQFQIAAKALEAKLFAPLVAGLGGAKLIFLSPDGPLHQIPFEALVNAEGQYLTEAGYRFAYLASGRDLLSPEHQAGTGSAVFAAPDYNLPLARRIELAKAAQPSAAAVASEVPPEHDGATQLVASAAPVSTRSYDVRGLRWDELPGARQEGEELVAQLAGSDWGPVASYVGEHAIEDEFKLIGRQSLKPRLLAVMTHGYFLADQSAEATGAGDTRGGLGASFRLGRLRSEDDPMLRSGLIFAGANQIDEKVESGDLAGDPTADDGWLTAAEIADLDLRGTDLVVLSACNSSSGKSENGQAVAGLRSAILLAGANTMIGSLFPAPDLATRQLMHNFYGGLLAGQGKLASLQGARLEMIARRRKENGAAHPFFWAGFVLVGKP